MHRSGFVNIIGNPNVGKSTLMNALVGEKISIITSKAQTTRHRILGIVNGTDFQIIYSDTPGIIKPVYQLQESMMKFVKTAISDADVILYVTDVFETAEKNMEYIEKIRKVKAPVILAINKTDLAERDKVLELMNLWKGLLPKAEIIEISALKSVNVSNVFDFILDKLPVHPPYFPEDQLTDKTERFFVAEIIREKIFLNYKQEIPYSVEAVVEEFKETDTLIRIRTTIYVMRETQKGILIGHKGSSLKKVGTEARKDIEEFFGKQVFLELHIKVKKDWREDQRSLKNFGYNQ